MSTVHHLFAIFSEVSEFNGNFNFLTNHSCNSGKPCINIKHLIKKLNMSIYIHSSIYKILNILLLLFGEMKRSYWVIIKVKLDL